MEASNALDVLVCDDHAVFAESLAAALRQDERFGDIRWADRPERALELAHERAPDLAIIDLRIPGVTGAELVRAMKAVEPTPKVLVLSVAADVRSIVGAFEAGADGFLGKHESFAAVLDGARSVAQGDVPISASAFARILPRLVPERVKSGLTAREEHVLELLAEQHTNDEIADALEISPNTARNHVSSILAKLDVDQRGQAVVKAREMGLIPDEV